MDFISLTHLQTALNKIKTMLNNKAELTDIPTELPANGGNADTARQTVSLNAKAMLLEDSEGGNLRLESPDGNHAVEMDLYNNSFRMLFRDNNELASPVNYNSTTKKFNINGNASTATALTSSAGTTHIPVRFSNGKPVAVSEILKYNTGGSLLHGNTTISYASGYKYALIFAYYNHNLGKTPEYTHPLAIALVGNMSSTTSYNEKPLTESGPNSLSFTVTNGDIIFNNNGGNNYGYLIIWSN